MKHPVLLTYRIPAAPMRALEAACDVERLDERPIPHARLVERVAGKQALLCLLTETIDRAVLEAGRDLKVVANIAVGYDNIDVAEAHASGDQRRFANTVRTLRRASWATGAIGWCPPYAIFGFSTCAVKKQQQG